MRRVMALVIVALLGASDRAVRLPQNPIVTPASSPTIGDNIDGPSLIRIDAPTVLCDHVASACESSRTLDGQERPSCWLSHWFIKSGAIEASF
jgi:hypothetical protein